MTHTTDGHASAGSCAGVPPATTSRARLLAGMPVSERRLQLAGVSTAVLEGGAGPPVVLLHGPGEYAAKWMRVIPDLVTTHRVIAPDLPGHGTSEVVDGAAGSRSRARVARRADRAHLLVAARAGGANSRRRYRGPFASNRGDRLSRLVLVDALGLGPFQPTPEFAHALTDFIVRPTEDTHDGLWRRCAFDLDGMRNRMGERWQRIKAYNLDRALTPSLQATQHSLMEQFGMPAIEPTELAKIAVPTALIWGRHDLATQLEVAEAASARYGWPLHVIENAGDDPPMEQPEAFLEALRAALGSSRPLEQRRKP